MLDLKLTLGCMIFISYTIVSVITRNFAYDVANTAASHADVMKKAYELGKEL